MHICQRVHVREREREAKRPRVPWVSEAAVYRL